MNEPTTYQKLGTRTLIVFILENCGPALIVTILWIIAFVVRIFGTTALGSMFPNTADAPAALGNIFDVILVAGLILICLAIAFAILLAAIDYYTYFFMLDENGLRIKQGLINKVETSLPYRQIQNVDIEQTLIHQMLGVARLAVLTAGQRGIEETDKADDNELTLPVIDKSRAEEIRQFLLEKSNIEKVVSVNPSAPAL